MRTNRCTSYRDQGGTAYHVETSPTLNSCNNNAVRTYTPCVLTRRAYKPSGSPFYLRAVFWGLHGDGHALLVPARPESSCG